MAEKTYTEEEVLRRERAAFTVGTKWGEDCALDGQYVMGAQVIEGEARRRYPIRKKVPRVVRDTVGGVVEWKTEHGRFYARCDGGEWEASNGYDITADRVLVWADLVANPFDEVDA